MAKLSYQKRKKLPKKSFVFPGRKGKGKKGGPAGKGAYPIPDIAHARNALARVSQFGSAAEKKAVRAKVYAKYPGLKKRAAKRGKK